jgi:hypothetical protein
MAIKNYRDIVIDKWMDNSGVCEVCNKPLCHGTPQLAHIMEKSKANIKKYGLDLIDHPSNLMLVCSLRCNSAALIGKSKTELIKKHIEGIK